MPDNHWMSTNSNGIAFDQGLARREFLFSAASGLGGMALSSMLAREGLFAAEEELSSPIRPLIRPEAPLAQGKAP